jgi:hypothetical protein
VPEPSPVQYIADGDPRDGLAGKFRQGMFMPRWASRDLLEVTGVACERLWDITEEQAQAEGIVERRGDGPWPATAWFAGTEAMGSTARGCFRELWIYLNGTESWDANPWVFAVSFRRITP